MYVVMLLQENGYLVKSPQRREGRKENQYLMTRKPVQLDCFSVSSGGNIVTALRPLRLCGKKSQRDE
jgi:hypothetical protein